MKPYLACALLACLLPAAGVHAAVADHVHASHGWLRVLPGSLPAAGYVILQNDGDQPAELSGASSVAYARVMLHESSMKGGMSRMTMIDALPVPAHGKVVLAPGGYHLMLMQPVTPVTPGQHVRVLLKFSDGSSLPTDFIARPASALDDGDTHAMRATRSGGETDHGSAPGH